MAFIKVCSLSELPNNSQKIVPLGPHKVALFHFNNEISAIANACLHKAGPLGLGLLTSQVFAYSAGTTGDPNMPRRLAGVAMCGVFLLGLLALPFAPETRGKPLPE